MNRQVYETCTRGNDLGEPYCATFKEDGVGSSVCEPYEAFKVMFHLFRVVQPVYKGSLQRLILNICTHNVTRATLVQFLLDMLITDVEGSTQNASSTSISSYRLYGCLGHGFIHGHSFQMESHLWYHVVCWKL